MFTDIFTLNPDAQKTAPIRPRKGVIIGVGQVGMACAYSMIIQNCFDELILQDIAEDKVKGEVLDLMQGLPFLPPTDLKAGTVADVGQNADIIIITAGAAQKPGETRLDLVEKNVAIYRNLLKDISKYCPNAILLIVSNPVDIMTYVTLKLTDFCPSKVIGSGTVLDTARFQALLGQKMGIDPRSVQAYIIGEHGDTEVPVWSTANVAGVHIMRQDWDNLSNSDQKELNDIFLHVKNAAYEIIKLKGYTSYAIGLATTDIVKAILRSEERILTVSSLLTGHYGLENVCLSIPTVVNEKGILKTVNLSLSELELKQLHNSAKVLREVFNSLKLEKL